VNLIRPGPSCFRQDFADMLVDSVMSRSVATIEPRRSAASAAQIMHERRFRHLPVVHNEQLVGIVSDRDIDGREDCAVADVMHHDVITVTPDAPIEVAAALMLDNKIGALPVVAEGSPALVGIVTQSDLFEVLVRLLGADQPSTRLELVLDDLSRQLSQVTALADKFTIPITSLITVPAADHHGRRRTVVLRVGTMVAGPLVAALRNAGITVNSL
jgi:acetoin utilization protein AcuB